MHAVRIAAWILTATLALAPAVALADHHEKAAPVIGTPGTTAEWDQEKVATLADELAQAVVDVRRTARNVPRAGVQTGQEASWMRFEDNLRILANETKTMARQLHEGRTHDETLQRYQRMGMLVRDIQENARRIGIPKDLQEKLDIARVALDKFDAYYA